MGHNNSTPVCPVPDENGPNIIPIVGTLTFHTLAIIVAGAAAAFSSIVAAFLTFRHATHFSNPAEQKQIIRIISILPSFSIICLLCVAFDGNPAQYIVPALGVAEAFPMAAFFLLMSTYVVPDGGDRESFFAQLELIDKKGNPQDGGSLKWYQKLSFAVMQWLPISIIVWIATVIALAAGTYCTTSNNIHFAHIWITIITAVSTSIAIMSILRFYRRSKDLLKRRGALQQLFCFKIIVFLNFLQTLIFSFLKSSGDLHATKYLTFNDLAYGLPSFILSLEVALLSPFFIFIYSVSPYIIKRSAEQAPSYYTTYHGPVHAFTSAINIFDIVGDLVLGMKARRGGRSKGSYLGAQNYVSVDGGHPYERHADGLGYNSDGTMLLDRNVNARDGFNDPRRYEPFHMPGP